MIILDNIDYEGLYAILNNSRIILFGAGKGVYTAYEYIFKMNKNLIHNIDFIADNFRCEEFLKLGDRYYNIISFDDLRSRCQPDHIIVISTQYFEEICVQINSYSEFADIRVLFYEDIDIANLLHCANIKQNMYIHDKPVIPKIIHYCWFGNKPIPERYKTWMSSWKKYCSEYEIVEWNESNYDYKKNEYMYEAYRSNKWGFVSDCARLDIIYNYGGIYFDTDVEIIRNMDNLLFQDNFLGMQPDCNIATGLGFGSTKYNKMIKLMMDDYKDRHFIRKDGSCDLTIAPVIQTNLLSLFGYKKINKFQIVNGLNIYPAPVLGAVIHGRVIVNENIYAIHHYDGSWCTEERKKNQSRWRQRLSNSIATLRNRGII